jgi:hypothetical protein
MMIGLRFRQIALSIGALCAASSVAKVHAQEASLHVLEELGRGVEVRQYPVKPGTLDTFSRRRDEAAAAAVGEVLGALGTPLLREVISETDIRLVYPKSLIIVSGRFSNGIICRIDVPVTGLSAGFEEETIAELAARSCRSAEEKNWGASGFTATTAIGSEPLEKVPGAKASVYATDQLHSLFSSLVREVEVGAGVRSSLVRQANRNESFPRDGILQWRYAWFENGKILAVRYQRQANPGSLEPGIGLSCAIVMPSDSLPSFEQGPFADWCNHQVRRLSPALDKYVTAVANFRNSAARDGSDTGVRMYGGFHQGPLPVQLTAQFWKTGELPDLQP